MTERYPLDRTTEQPTQQREPAPPAAPQSEYCTCTAENVQFDGKGSFIPNGCPVHSKSAGVQPATPSGEDILATHICQTVKQVQEELNSAGVQPSSGWDKYMREEGYKEYDIQERFRQNQGTANQRLPEGAGTDNGLNEGMSTSATVGASPAARTEQIKTEGVQPAAKEPMCIVCGAPRWLHPNSYHDEYSAEEPAPSAVCRVCGDWRCTDPQHAGVQPAAPRDEDVEVIPGAFTDGRPFGNPYYESAGVQPSALQPTYFVKHPDGTYSIAEPQPLLSIAEDQGTANQRLPEGAGTDNETEGMSAGRPTRAGASPAARAEQVAEQVWQIAVDEIYSNIHPSGDAFEKKVLPIIEQAIMGIPSAGVQPAAPLDTRFQDFDDANHPFRQWWEKHGQLMMAGGGRKESIWAARGWIAREQLADGVPVTGESLGETPSERVQPSAPSAAEVVSNPPYFTQPEIDAWRRGTADATSRARHAVRWAWQPGLAGSDAMQRVNQQTGQELEAAPGMEGVQPSAPSEEKPVPEGDLDNFGGTTSESWSETTIDNEAVAWVLRSEAEAKLAYAASRTAQPTRLCPICNAVLCPHGVHKGDECQIAELKRQLAEAQLKASRVDAEVFRAERAEQIQEELREQLAAARQAGFEEAAKIADGYQTIYASSTAQRAEQGAAKTIAELIREAAARVFGEKP